MDQFIQALTSWGVAPLTVLLVAAILYWLLVIAGALDLDLFHLAGDHEHDHGHGDGDHHSGLGSGLLEFLSIGKVPLTVIASILAFTGWTVAMASELLLPLWWLLDFSLAVAVAIPVTAGVCRPLRLLFRSLDRGIATGINLLGREARITSATCDQRFGTAACTVADGDEILMDVISIRPGQIFHRHDVVVVADYDAEHQRYLVGPADYRRDALPAPEADKTPESIPAPSTQPTNHTPA